MAADPYADLGAYLTAYEADRLARVLAAGGTTSQALKEVHTYRRPMIRQLLHAADLGQHRTEISVAVLRAVASARSVHTISTPVWTMPGAQATVGRLTSEALHLIDEARMSVVCASYNFTQHSGMWTALREASCRPGVSVTVYLDAHVGSPTTVAAQLPTATIYATSTLPGTTRPLVSHAKFIIVDRTLTLLTSANFSYSAEQTNIELGLLVQDAAMADSIESVMRSKHGILYELVTC